LRLDEVVADARAARAASTAAPTFCSFRGRDSDTRIEFSAG